MSGEGGGGTYKRSEIEKCFKTSYIAVLIKILFEFTWLFKLHNILKNLNSLQYKLEKGVGEGGRFKGFIIGWNKRSNADFTVGIYI